MSLNLYGKTNYEVEVPLSVMYAREAAVQADIWQPTRETQWRYTRRARKTYSFKGMTEAAVKACLEAKRQQYNRRFMYWTIHDQHSNPYYHNADEYSAAGYSGRVKAPYYDLVAQFDVTRTSDARVFNIRITVDETIALYSVRDYDPNDPTKLDDIEELFMDQTVTLLPQRFADDTTGGPRYNSYLREYTYDEGLATDTIVT